MGDNELLPKSVLDPGYPRRVSVETAQKWLHDLGFDVLQMSKGMAMSAQMLWSQGKGFSEK